MFIELTEHLKCPASHDETHLVLLPDQMVGRMVVRGTVGCPVCRADYPVENGMVRFGPAPPAQVAAPLEAGLADAVHALLGLSNPGGFVALVGSACGLAAPLGRLMGGVHFVGINPPGQIEASPWLSPLAHGTSLPLRSAMARGVVLGSEYGGSPWPAEAARVLLGGLRLVVLRSEIVPPAGVTPLAAGKGLWVGEKRRR